METQVMKSVPEAVESWLVACGERGIEPRLTGDKTHIVLRAGDVGYRLEGYVIPEIKAVMEASYKDDSRWFAIGSTRNGYSSCLYLLRVADGVSATVTKADGRGKARTTKTKESDVDRLTRMAKEIAEQLEKAKVAAHEAAVKAARESLAAKKEQVKTLLAEVAAMEALLAEEDAKAAAAEEDAAEDAEDAEDADA